MHCWDVSGGTGMVWEYSLGRWSLPYKRECRGLVQSVSSLQFDKSFLITDQKMV